VFKIIIANYNTPDMLMRCLRSIKALGNVPYHLYIIDNGSQRESTKLLAERGPGTVWDLFGDVPDKFDVRPFIVKWTQGVRGPKDNLHEMPWQMKELEVRKMLRGGRVTTLCLEKNYGYETALNAGYVLAGEWPELAAARNLREERHGDFLLLGSDTEVFPDALGHLEQTFSFHNQIGIVGAKLVQKRNQRWYVIVGGYRDVHGREHIQGWDDNPFGEWQRYAEYPWATFSAVAIRRELIREVGPMDMTYHVFHGDADFCRRARRLGWAVVYCPKARVVHHESHTVNMLRNQTPPTVWKAWRKTESSYHHEKFKNVALPEKVLAPGFLIGMNQSLIDSKDPRGGS
jgi:GT2 family glycosyltransferase